MIQSMKRAVLLLPLALVGCGGTVDGSPADGGSDLGDATGDAIATGDSTDATSLIGDAGMGDATLPPRPDGSAPQDGGPTFYDAPFFPDALCGPATCKFGCCSGIGECIEPTTDQACGWYGIACEPCADGGTCQGGDCVYTLWTCGPSNCGGCCIGNQSFGDAAQTGCFPGTEEGSCGSAGSGCTICKPGETCRPLLFDAGGFCQANSTTCDPTNCTGCCINGICAQGDQAMACGIGGVACKDCGDGGACQEGNCSCGPPFFPPCGDD
jgi:hypothetical protein